MVQRKMVAPLFVAMVLALAWAGCGGESSDGAAVSASGDTPPPITASSLTKAQHVKRANALCRRNRQKVQAAMDTYGEEHQDESIEERFKGAIDEVYVPAMLRQLAELRELGAPRGDERQVERIIVAYEEAYASLAALENSESTPEVDRQLNQAGALARRYNLLQCTFA